MLGPVDIVRWVRKACAYPSQKKQLATLWQIASLLY